MAEATIAGINAGVYAMSAWTFVDWPDTKERSVNHWGLFPWSTGAAIPRAPYYCYPLMTKFFRGPATVHQVEAGCHGPGGGDSERGDQDLVHSGCEPQAARCSDLAGAAGEPGQSVPKVCL